MGFGTASHLSPPPSTEKRLRRMDRGQSWMNFPFGGGLTGDTVPKIGVSFLCSTRQPAPYIISPEVDVRIVSAHSNGLIAYAGYISGTMGGSSMRIRYWAGRPVTHGNCVISDILPWAAYGN